MAFLERFKQMETRLRGIESFLAQLNSTNSVSGSSNSPTLTTSPQSSTPDATITTVDVGLSGLVVVTGSAYFELACTPTNNGYIAASLFVDGTSYIQFFLTLANSSQSNVGSSQSATIVVDSLPVGSHTFELRFFVGFSANASIATWDNNTITAEPI